MRPDAVLRHVLIAWFPKAVLAGLLLFLGWSLLERWLIEGPVAVAAAGIPGRGHYRAGGLPQWAFLQGVVVGLLGAIVLFVINYSRINVVRYALTGAERRSNVERNFQEEKYLRENGGQTRY